MTTSAGAEELLNSVLEFAERLFTMRSCEPPAKLVMFNAERSVICAGAVQFVGFEGEGTTVTVTMSTVVVAGRAIFGVTVSVTTTSTVDVEVEISSTVTITVTNFVTVEVVSGGSARIFPSIISTVGSGYVVELVGVGENIVFCTVSVVKIVAVS